MIGYLLGGGLSFYARAHGLAVNHVRAFEVVTPDGTRRRVDDRNGADLFYALRGGGGNFAIVTAVELGLLPYAEVTGGAMFFPAKDAFAVLRAWRDWTVSAPDTITTTYRLLCLPPLPEVPEPLRGVPTVCVDGVALDPADAVGLERRLRYVSQPILGGFGPMPSAAVVRLHGDPEDPVPAVGDGMLLERLDDLAIEMFLRVAGPGSPLLAAELRHLGGALAAPAGRRRRPGASGGQLPPVRRGDPGRAGSRRRARRAPGSLPRGDGAVGDRNPVPQLRGAKPHARVLRPGAGAQATGRDPAGGRSGPAARGLPLRVLTLTNQQRER